MTRKRKSVSVVENCYWGCGPNAPIKAVDSNWSSEFMENFNQRYGHIDYVEKWKKENLDQRFSTAETDYREEHELAVDTKNFEHNMEYPSELVEYMKQVACIIRDDPSLSGDLQRKCLEECQGSEISLCRYSMPCFLIDEIFNGSRDAARQWMFKIMQLGKDTSLKLLYMPWSCRTLETLLSSLSNALDTQ
ncbi:hypothetical protein WUBG_11385, partial [Wuchereria bancrofti]